MQKYERNAEMQCSSAISKENPEGNQESSVFWRGGIGAVAVVFAPGIETCQMCLKCMRTGHGECLRSACFYTNFTTITHVGALF